jgi:nitrite reductase/ring-hydroxylating ferredoxin subunit
VRAKIAFLFQLAAFQLLPISCGENEPLIVPDVAVDITLQLSLPQYSALNAVNNAIKLGGYGYRGNGVVVYRYSLDQFYAFDATCPQHIEQNASVALDDNGSAGTATCPHCKTVYYLYNDGYPKSGYRLKKYSTALQGGSLHVFN